jgi:hypothetical protein
MYILIFYLVVGGEITQERVFDAFPTKQACEEKGRSLLVTKPASFEAVFSCTYKSLSKKDM